MLPVHFKREPVCFAYKERSRFAVAKETLKNVLNYTCNLRLKQQLCEEKIYSCVVLVMIKE